MPGQQLVVPARLIGIQQPDPHITNLTRIHAYRIPQKPANVQPAA
jgi:hypothetical protein